ncbi:MAG: hypothetical protein K0R82_1939 [Flavipsychrobacter sp.]|jgi:hypothetical protein|nr:hypothetical protein [Flavipsychrobacter sp.]
MFEQYNNHTMKKLNLPLIATLALFASLTFASCKKDHTCACNVSFMGLYDTTINFEIEEQTNKQAKRLCDNNETTIPTYSAALFNNIFGGAQDSGFGMPIVITPGMISTDCDLN